jgi:AcrR family transcriptional regulator
MGKSSDGNAGEATSWRQRAVSKSLSAARTRAEQRVQRLLDAAFELIDEKGSAEFTIQEVVDRSGQSLRGFYQYFEGKDELLFALLEESIEEAITDLREVAEREAEPLASLRAFTIRLHEWCEPTGAKRKRGSHNRVPLSDFSMQLAFKDPGRLAAVMAPVSRLLNELLDAAIESGDLEVAEPRRAAMLVQQIVIFGWFMNRLVPNPRARVSAEDAWEFCLHGLGG